MKLNQLFLKKAAQWALQFEHFAILNSNNCNTDKYGRYNTIIACKSISKFESESGLTDLNKWLSKQNNWVFGHLNYDVKNEIENLSSKHKANSTFPNIHFFVPETIIIEDYEGKITIQSKLQISQLYEEINAIKIHHRTPKNKILVQETYFKNEYIEAVNYLQKQIIEGNIYEINFCKSLVGKNVEINEILATYDLLKANTNAPFSVLYRVKDSYLFCASPERFIQKNDFKIISQPIKGTIQRGKNETEDEDLKKKLLHDDKEKAENVMIVDLVRNDLSKIAEIGTVKVSELFGIYTFKTVHQMISTIEAQLQKQISFENIIKALFPMGSMTGAPKVSAMQLIDETEKINRDIFSGTFGYISPDKNFDFNVIIRSIIYQSKQRQIKIFAGSAITHYADSFKEFDECKLKSKALLKTIHGKIEK